MDKATGVVGKRKKPFAFIERSWESEQPATADFVVESQAAMLDKLRPKLAPNGKSTAEESSAADDAADAVGEGGITGSSQYRRKRQRRGNYERGGGGGKGA